MDDVELWFLLKKYEVSLSMSLELLVSLPTQQQQKQKQLKQQQRRFCEESVAIRLCSSYA
jgi:BarA-like signal transduction histidine kinase